MHWYNPLIHTSDPGQYGVNKSDETVDIKKLIDQYNEAYPEKPVYLIGNVDGVGFSENPNGTIAKMLVSLIRLCKSTLCLKLVFTCNNSD